jgi:hypothetical protein
MPIGLEDVTKYPHLFERLSQIDEPRWSTEDLQKLAGLNLIRVFKEVEMVCINYCSSASLFSNLQALGFWRDSKGFYKILPEILRHSMKNSQGFW